MKAVLMLSLVLASASAVFGQTPTEAYAPPGVAIVKYSAHPVAQNRDWDTLGSASAENQSMGDVRNQSSSFPMSPAILPPVRGREGATEKEKSRSSSAPVLDISSPAPSAKGVSDRPLYDYFAQIKNVSDKTIMAIAWEYWFIHPETGAQIDTRKFKSFRRLAPGKSVTLNAASSGPRVISATIQGKKRKPDERVIIRCLAYEDGQVMALSTSSGTQCINFMTH
jgi:hypothetical protein